MEKVERTKPSATKISPNIPSFVKPDTNDSTLKLFRWLRVLGINMPKNHKVAYVIYSIIYNTLTILLLPQFFALSYFKSGKMPIGLLLTSVQACVNTYSCAFKFLFIAFLRKNFFTMRGIIKKLDARVKHPDEMDEIQKVITFGRRTFMGLATFYFSYSSLTFLGGLLMGRPPYSLYIPFLNWRDSRRSLFIVSIMEYTLMNMACYQNVANDAYGIVYVRVIHTHVKLLISRVLRIGSDGKSSQKENREELVLCIRDHKNIIELINTLAPLLSATVFIQFFVSAVVLSTTLINLLIFGEESAIIGSIAYVVAVTSEFFPICYFVNCLVYEGERLPIAIFHMNWTDQDIKFRRMCLLFMHKSQQPVVFLAGKMLPITLGSFLSIVKFSFSLYTFLSKMDFAEKFN